MNDQKISAEKIKDASALKHSLCQCGCGQPTRIQGWNDVANGYVKGQPKRYVFGHRNRKSSNKVTHFNDGVSVLALEYKGDVFSCYIETQDYPLVARRWWSVVNKRGTLYAATYRPKAMMHQLIMPLADGRTPDHIDRNGLNNRRDNLRSATASQQQANQRLFNNNASGYKGVCWSEHAKKYKAEISVSGKKKHLGYFNSAFEAALVYDAVALRTRGEFATTNASLGLLKKSVQSVRLES